MAPCAVSRLPKASTEVTALEHALIARFGTLRRVDSPFLLRSDNGLVFTSRAYTAMVRSYGLKQEFNISHCPQENGIPLGSLLRNALSGSEWSA
ncbi:hypothetical protein R5H30_14240 [Sulfitobacter sp. D35]|uniref:hypothetical protein n=1 Tax=Sulfitobacter sp. D35 TaxID=3083252 RepID=UPI00296F98BA|nr:hypothetical protein [Sulfitobacter sp. D35]MDW4499152.1 hypothetical protein [Sulfitobacter sp. D35]